MRTFVKDILCPPPGSPIPSSQPTSSEAIASVLLDDAGLNPDDLGHGVTVIECEHVAINGAIVPHVQDALLPRKSTASRRSARRKCQEIRRPRFRLWATTLPRLRLTLLRQLAIACSVGSRKA